VDKLIPKLGYVAGNVYLICKRCNMLKSDGDLQELEAIVHYIRRKL
jgi:hypothetical protein